MILWGQLAAKAVISGLIVAAASEIARRSPGWGGLIASLPLTSLLALVWLWRSDPDPLRAADFLRAGVYPCWNETRAGGLCDRTPEKSEVSFHLTSFCLRRIGRMSRSPSGSFSGQNVPSIPSSMIA